MIGWFKKMVWILLKPYPNGWQLIIKEPWTVTPVPDMEVIIEEPWTS